LFSRDGVHFALQRVMFISLRFARTAVDRVGPDGRSV